MAKKSQTKVRRSNTRTGKQVVNFYNNGTVNVDGRQNRSCTYKTENRGCTNNYSHHPVANPIVNDFQCLDQVEHEALSHDRTGCASKKLSSSMVPTVRIVKNVLLLTTAMLAIITVGSLFKSK